MPAKRTNLHAAVAIVATYVYFLLFAQYGFIRLIGERGGDALAVDRAMAGMGLSGLAASFLAAFLLTRIAARRLLKTPSSAAGSPPCFPSARILR